MSSSDQFADFLTNPLGATQFQNLRTKLWLFHSHRFEEEEEETRALVIYNGLLYK